MTTTTDDAVTATVETTITDKRIADLMTTAVECNDMTTQWCAGVYLSGPYKEQEDELKTDEGYPWYANPYFYARDDFEIEVVEVVDEGEDWDDETNLKRHRCDRAKLKQAFELMARDNKRHFDDFLGENEDAITADVFLQLLALGEIVYG